MYIHVTNQDPIVLFYHHNGEAVGIIAASLKLLINNCVNLFPRISSTLASEQSGTKLHMDAEHNSIISADNTSVIHPRFAKSSG